jgi:hypothetical protein
VTEPSARDPALARRAAAVATPEQVAAWQRDGAVCLRGLLSPAEVVRLKRGIDITEFQNVGNMITEVLDGLAANGDDGNAAVEAAVKKRAVELCERFPIYQ